MSQLISREYRVASNEKKFSLLATRCWPLKSKKGATLVEAVVAIALASIVITAIVGLVVSAVASSTSSKARTTATRYAEEGIEVVRKVRDRTTWNNFWSTYVTNTSTDCPTATPCQVDSSLNLTIGAGVSITPYTRTVAITSAETGAPGPGLQDRVQVTVLVTWPDKGQTDEVRLVTYLTQWRR